MRYLGIPAVNDSESYVVELIKDVVAYYLFPLARQISNCIVIDTKYNRNLLKLRCQPWPCKYAFSSILFNVLV